jgi:hypothetical protein
VLNGPFGQGQDFPTTTQSQSSSLDVQTVVLNAAGSPVGSQALAGGSPVQVNVTSQNTSVGTITTSPVTIAPGTSDALTDFQPLSNGTTLISAVGPAPFAVPTQGASMTATVSTPKISIAGGFNVGNHLEQQVSIVLGAPPKSDLTVTLTVTNGPMLLSATGTDGGSASINVVIPAGTQSGSFFMYGGGSSGSATIAASASGYASTTATNNLVPSGVVIGSELLGYGSNVTAAAGTTQPVVVQTVQLDPSGNVLGTQPLAGGAALTVNLSSSDTAVGTIPATASIAGGSDTGTVNFTAKASGMTTLSVAQPSGFSTPTHSASIQAIVP